MIFLALALQLLGIRDAVSATDLGGGVIDTISKLGGISSTLILITVGYRIHMDNPDKIRESLRLALSSDLLRQLWGQIFPDGPHGGAGFLF